MGEIRWTEKASNNPRAIYDLLQKILRRTLLGL